MRCLPSKHEIAVQPAISSGPTCNPLHYNLVRGAIDSKAIYSTQRLKTLTS
jgi:hypothetical protein